MELTINKNKFKVKTVISPKDTSQGMMNKRFDDTFNGMLFIMSEGQHCFWMKNCITIISRKAVNGQQLLCLIQLTENSWKS